jgi:hypothetical protein
MTGRGEGYCAIRFPGPGQPALGYAGRLGQPVYLEALALWLPEGARLARRFHRIKRRGPRLGHSRRLAGVSSAERRQAKASMSLGHRVKGRRWNRCQDLMARDRLDPVR